MGVTRTVVEPVLSFIYFIFTYYFLLLHTLSTSAIWPTTVTGTEVATPGMALTTTATTIAHGTMAVAGRMCARGTRITTMRVNVENITTGSVYLLGCMF